jgi:hypothetical protein
VAVTDWTRYRKCPHCHAETGEACTSLTGALGDGSTVRIDRDRPHGGRQPRTGGAS